MWKHICLPESRSEGEQVNPSCLTAEAEMKQAVQEPPLATAGRGEHQAGDAEHAAAPAGGQHPQRICGLVFPPQQRP